MPLLIDPMINAPSNADQIVPRPPNKLVPPITAAAIAFNKTSPLPDPVSTAYNRDAATIPPQAAMPEQRVKTTMRILSTSMLARLAASGFPPTA